MRVWEDDPGAGQPVERPVPKLPTGNMQFAIDAPAPPPALYERHTPEFRYWATVDALKRGVSFWSALLPKGTTWQRGPTLDVRVDAGDKLNALYNRASLAFFHATVEGKAIYTAESPDVVCHEMGHAVLDAIRPQLWDAMSHEVAAFHESFGDMSAILSALQVRTLREQVFEETGGLYRNSRLSRVAEQLGWAVGRRQPCAVDADALRNAVNCFFYRPAAQLPPVAPSCALSSAAHSYSRVFTGAFFESFAGMVITQGRPTTPDFLKQAGLDWAKLLVAAVLAAPIEPSYMAQVAIHMLQADKELFNGKYAPALENGFLRKGILTASSAAAASRATPPRGRAAAVARAAAASSAELPALTLDGAEFGLGDRPVVVRAAAETPRLAAAASALDGSPVTPQSSAGAARAFLSEVVLRDHLFRPDRHGSDDAPDERLRTHVLVEDGDALVVERRLFEAGPCLRHGRYAH
ncbi:MAG: hypothetical protein ACR2MO_12410 [Acidimicrobiales bacterium]